MRSLGKNWDFCKFMLSDWRVFVGLVGTLFVFLLFLIIAPIEGASLMEAGFSVFIMASMTFIVGGLEPCLSRISDWNWRKEIVKRIHLNGHAPLQI